jgi:zona occludens toxin (predicted ATPase)
MPKRISKSWKIRRRRLRIFLVFVFLGIIIGGFFVIRGKWFATGEVDAKKVIPQTYTQALEVSLGNKKLTVTPMAGNPVKVVQKDVRYIYENAYKNTDVIQTIYPYRIKEELVFYASGHPLNSGINWAMWRILLWKKTIRAILFFTTNKNTREIKN